MTTIFTGFSSFGLIAVSAWFALERVIYTKHKGERWLADILADVYTDLHQYSGIAWAEKNVIPFVVEASTWCQCQAKRWWSAVKSSGQTCGRLLCCLRTTEPETARNGMTEKGTLPLPNLTATTNRGSALVLSPPVSPTKPENVMMVESPKTLHPGLTLSSPDLSSTKGYHARKSTEHSLTMEMNSTPPVSSSPTPDNGQTTGVSTARNRFTSAVRSVIMLQHASNPTGGLLKRTTGTGNPFISHSHSNSDGGLRSLRKEISKPSPAAKISRMILLSHSLKTLDNTETTQVHQALVRHLQFSPNGKWLATCSWDGTSKLYKVGYGVS